ncbi:MAG: membrane protein [Paracoccaceae bacterium]|nr:MAG: membrane protein [Paracoccaceae bacterium]
MQPDPSANARGAIFMVVSMGAFTCNDALMKLALESVPFHQALAVRGAIACALVGAALLAARPAGRRIAPRDRARVALRSLAEVAATICFISALVEIGLPRTSAILQATPLAVTLGAALFLGEPIGWRRALAIAIGLLGVLLIIRPGPEGFTAGSLWAALAVLVVVARDLVTRTLSPATASLPVTAAATVALTAYGWAGMLFTDWRAMAPAGLLYLAASAVFLMIGYQTAILAMRVGEVGFAAPFRYTALVWALLLGWLIFDDIPGPVTLTGAAIVVGSGLYAFWRERRLARRAGARPRPAALP